MCNQHRCSLDKMETPEPVFKRQVITIDVGNMTKKDALMTLDPSGKMWRQYKLENYLYIGCAVVGVIAFIFLII